MAPRDRLDEKLHSLLKATVQSEHLIAIRDAEILAIQRKHAPALEREQEIIAKLAPEIEVFATANRAKLELDGSKCVQLGSGMIGWRAPAHPALVPFDEKWNWSKIERKLRTKFKARFFHAPKPAGVHKNKVKAELSDEQLADCGLRLDRTEVFYCELNRLDQADSTRVAA